MPQNQNDENPKEELKKKIKELIKKNKTGQALKLLASAQFSHIEVPITNLSASFNRLKDQDDNQIISREAYNLEISKINHKLLSLVDRSDENKAGVKKKEKGFNKLLLIIPLLLIGFGILYFGTDIFKANGNDDPVGPNTSSTIVPDHFKLVGDSLTKVLSHTTYKATDFIENGRFSFYATWEQNEEIANIYIDTLQGEYFIKSKINGENYELSFSYVHMEAIQEAENKRKFHAIWVQSNNRNPVIIKNDLGKPTIHMIIQKDLYKLDYTTFRKAEMATTTGKKGMVVAAWESTITFPVSDFNDKTKYQITSSETKEKLRYPENPDSNDGSYFSAIFDYSTDPGRSSYELQFIKVRTNVYTIKAVYPYLKGRYKLLTCSGFDNCYLGNVYDGSSETHYPSNLFLFEMQSDGLYLIKSPSSNTFLFVNHANKLALTDYSDSDDLRFKIEEAPITF